MIPLRFACFKFAQFTSIRVIHRCDSRYSRYKPWQFSDSGCDSGGAEALRPCGRHVGGALAMRVAPKKEGAGELNTRVCLEVASLHRYDFAFCARRRRETITAHHNDLHAPVPTATTCHGYTFFAAVFSTYDLGFVCREDLRNNPWRLGGGRRRIPPARPGRNAPREELVAKFGRSRRSPWLVAEAERRERGFFWYRQRRRRRWRRRRWKPRSFEYQRHSRR